MNYLNTNLDCIKKRYPRLYEEVIQVHSDESTYEILETRDRNVTVRMAKRILGQATSFFIHSKYNPLIEAQKFAQEQCDSKFSTYILYGFGLGYHIFEIAKLMGSKDRLFIIENNLSLFKIALKYADLSQIFLNPNVHLIVSIDIGYICDEMKNLLELIDVKLIFHPASIKAIPEENEYFKFVMENWNLKKSISGDWDERLNKNLLINKQNTDLNVGILFDKFSNFPIIIVSSGPSLDKNISLLHEVHDKAVIIAVGSALKALMKNGIKPNLFVIIDPQEETEMQIQGLEEVDVPFIYLATAAASTVSKFRGLRLIACQEKEYLNEDDPYEYVVDSGGSVATTALDIAIKMGGNPIILVGQDLAYTEDKNHADDATLHPNIQSNRTSITQNMRRVIGQKGEILFTTLGLLSFKYWIENRIDKEKDTIFINATEGGAYIQGMIHTTLRDVINQYLKESMEFQNRLYTLLKESRKKYVSE